MDPLFVYIIKVNIALFVFWFFCRFVIGKDTYLRTKRICLLIVLGLPFLYPLFDFSDWIDREQQVAIVHYVFSMEDIVFSVDEKPSLVTWENGLWLFYGVGCIFLTIRMIYQLFVIGRMVRKGKRLECLGTEVISPGQGTAPFSFLKWIFIHPEDYTLRELQEILAHEKAHVRQWHSVDMLLSEVICIVFWFNPAVWLLRYEIRQNLEFLADQKVVQAGYNRKNYQYHLLRLSHQSAAVQIVNNFNVSQLKKRIIMMNKTKTSRAGLLKYALLIPVTGLLVIVSNVQVLGRVINESTSRIEKTEAVVIEGSKTGMPKVKDWVAEGRVTDVQGKPLAGAIVLVKGTSTGSATDKDGNFSLKFKDASTPTLVISFVGMESAERVLKDQRTNLQIQLKQEPVTIEDIVVVGYAKEKETSQEEFELVEVMPEFPGGNVELRRFILMNLRYPEKAMKEGIQGKVFVYFTIDENGKVVHPKVMRSISPELDEEALRVVKLMPDWKPGMQSGKAVATDYVVPVEFKLTKGEIVGIQKNEPLKKENNRRASINENVLIVVDGQIMPADFQLNSISPKDIESISILKNEEAMNAYGGKGKEGVIVIKTSKK